VIRVTDEQFWLYAAVDPVTNQVLQIRLYPRRTTVITEMLLTELKARHDVN
jgi:putative transposase